MLIGSLVSRGRRVLASKLKVDDENLAMALVVGARRYGDTEI